MTHYADIVEVVKYESNPLVYKRRRRRTPDEDEGGTTLALIPFDGEAASAPIKQAKVRDENTARRSVLAFRKLCIANLDRFGNPIWASFTYAENMDSLARARQDWAAFVKRAEYRFGPEFRFIAVTEFQKRGAVHYHAFLWGLPANTVEEERRSRVVATLWGHGFVDLVNTDGSPKMATYMSKYATKNFMDIRFAGRRLYSASKNIVRPVVDRGAILAMYNGDVPGYPDLSTGVVVHESEYDTISMGRAIYKKYKLLKAYDADSNAPKM